MRCFNSAGLRFRQQRQCLTISAKVSATQEKPSAGDPIPPKCAVIEVHVGELKQLFNAIDPFFRR
jgi:hypothetical protein